MKVCPRCGLKYPDDEARCYVDKAELQAAQDDRIGTVLKGRYEIEAPIGEGGMAIVYRARSTLVDRPVAVKVMNAHLVRDSSLVERFRREAKNAAAVAHPNIIDILDYGETDEGTPFLVMELLEGEPLDVIIARGPIPPPQAAALGLQIAKGLARAHDFQVLHRDLKPENVFVCKDEQGKLSMPKILDFGIARSMHDQRLTSAGQIFGTPPYMAPERVTSVDAGPSADLYALGIILFEMVAGRLPFESEEMAGYFIKHLQDPPPKLSDLIPQVPRRLEELVLKLLAKRPEQRPVDAHAVVRELSAIAPEPMDLGPMPQGRVSRPEIAPTLPPATLDRWTHRAAIFDEMLRKAYDGKPPPDLVEALQQIHAIIGRLLDLRASGLKEQRKLDVIEGAVNDSRERLGHAVHVLAQDLSSTREAARSAEREAQPYFDAQSSAHDLYRRAHSRYLSLAGAAPISAPTPAIVQATREMADAMDRWLLAHDTADKARRWLAAKHREIEDLQFQADALRAQLERLESTFEGDRGHAEAVLRDQAAEVLGLEMNLTELAGAFVEPLHAKADLGDLFARLQIDSFVA